MVPGLILAAGRSSRMGRPKALLRADDRGRTFVETLATALASGGVSDVLIVGRPDDAALKAEVERVGAAATGAGPMPGPGSVRYVENVEADTGQLSSAIAGINAVDRPGVRGALIVPVDMPRVSATTIARLLDVFSRRGGNSIVRAVYGGAHGHPVIFGRVFFDELRSTDRSVGAKAVLRAHPDAIVDVEVADPGVAMDVDTPGDYERMFGRQVE